MGRIIGIFDKYFLILMLIEGVLLCLWMPPLLKNQI